MVRYGPGQEAAARTVAAAIPGSDLRKADVKEIEVVIGADQPKVAKPKASTTPSARPSASPSAETATQNICKK
ncbi:hypothetical protein ACFSTC_49490 [Nonomuraea ferruginea]